MKSMLLFFVTAVASIFGTADAFRGCDNTYYNQLCKTEMINRCYNCVNNIHAFIPPVCVPILKNNIGTLENFPSPQWKCSPYIPEPIKEPVVEPIEEEPKQEDQNEEGKISKELCEIDEFIYDVCENTDENGFCLIASYIHDICHQKDNHEHKQFELTNNNLLKYESPWGPLSDCNQYFYKEICTNKVAKFCFDCRKFLGKELFTQRPRYSYYCSPFYKDMNEKETTDWLAKEKYECKRWYNPDYKPSVVQYYEGGQKAYSACTGPICSKEGWTFKETHFGKEWCGLGTCKEYFGNRVLCTFPVNCGKKLTNEYFQELNSKITTLSCNKEKFKCMLHKDCRDLIKDLQECKNNNACMFSVVLGADDKNFLDLVSCMHPN
jgi:hypothetical protein